ncbi:MAG: AmmeMemoRadiSam system protein B [Syntrophothermus sp.]
MQVIRRPAVAGMFYPAGEERLRQEISLLLDTAGKEGKDEKIFGIIVPHAGYVYSGRTAAFAFNRLKGKKYNTAVVISPSHREYFPGVSVYSGDAYETPLGIVPVDKSKAAELTRGSRVIFAGLEGHRQEHALEVQIPFLQYVLGSFSLVPVVIGDQSEEYVYALAENLSRIWDENTLIVASTDLSHFHSKMEADKLDSVVENRISSFDYTGLMNDLQHKYCEACGGGPVAALMKTADILGKRKSMVLDRSDSGDITHDNSEVVGYLSAIIYE